MKINQAMGKVLKDCVAIAKDRRNQQQGFQYRGVDDAYNALHPVMAKHGVFTIPRVLKIKREERQTKAGGTLTYTIMDVEYDFICCEDGSKITAGPIKGEAMDTADKSCNKALAMAHKYILFQTFMIPTEQEDADATTYDVLTDSATDKQLASIQEYRDAGEIHKPTEDWIAKQKPLTEKQAAGLLRRLKKEEKKDD